MSSKRRFSDDIRTALNIGTTLTTRLWLAFAALFQGGGFMMQNPSWLSHPSFASLNEVIPLWWWGVAFVSAGVLGMWRVLSAQSWPSVAWIVNGWMALVWSCAVSVRFYGTGPTSLLSLYTVIALMAFWVNIRTQATARDTETA